MFKNQPKTRETHGNYRGFEYVLTKIRRTRNEFLDQNNQTDIRCVILPARLAPHIVPPRHPGQ